jgi:hypothetical protein
MDSSAQQSQAIRLFQYLQELARLKSKPIRSLDSYENVLWLVEAPRSREVQCVLWRTDEGRETPDDWIEAKKPPLHPVPPLPEELELWVGTYSLRNPEREPRLKEKVELRHEESGEVSVSTLADSPEILLQFDAYLARWRDWAKKEIA